MNYNAAISIFKRYYTAISKAQIKQTVLLIMIDTD